MNTRMTVFKATLVQDSALSVSGLDRDNSSDQPFSIDDDGPVLVGRGLKGAAVAMARRFFEPLPRSISEDAERKTALRRSAWEFLHARPEGAAREARLRAGVGIRHKTGARAGGVLYDREVFPAGTRWRMEIRVDWSHAGSAAQETEGILGYVLAEHWRHGRCWLGGGAARGLGWCHLENLEAWRLDERAYDRWVVSGRRKLPKSLSHVPIVQPTRSWCFRTIDIEITAGEHRPDPDGPAWGLDMLAIGPHDADRAFQRTGDGNWARPSWATRRDSAPPELSTDRAILMDGDRPVLPGSTLRGPMRHALSRILRAQGLDVQDPHPVQGKVGASDRAGQVFGTVETSSRVLIRDGRAAGDWAAARLHMHAEDEFSAGSYGSAKRDAVRLLRASFPVRVVVEGPAAQDVEPLVAEIDRLVALGALGHLPIGGHKTRGAGWGRWIPGDWQVDNVEKERSWEEPPEPEPPDSTRGPGRRRIALPSEPPPAQEDAWVRVTTGTAEQESLTLGQAATSALQSCGEARELVAWWCEPAIDLDLNTPPATFGREWPEGSTLAVDEIAFFLEGAAWRAARTCTGTRWVLIEEVAPETAGAERASRVDVPARLHQSNRFQAAKTGDGLVHVREWRVGDELIGYTLSHGGA